MYLTKDVSQCIPAISPRFQAQRYDYITTAYTSLLNVNPYVMRVSKLWDFTVFNSYVLDRPEDERRVLAHS